VVSKCLEKRPEDRFNSAHDLSITLGTLDTIASVPAIQEQSFFVKRWPHVLAVVIAAVIALLVIWPPEALFERGAIEPALEPLPRIVVLPFENLGSPEDEYFSDGITDEITSRLTAVSGLEVISRTSAMYYKGRHLPLSQVGEELNVGYVLEGTIRWDHGGEGHGRVRITPQLVRVDDDTHLWSDRYDRMLDDIFDVQARIAEEVVTRLQATILEPERRAIEARLTKNAEAYEAFLLGQQLSKDFEIHENLELAIVSLERAVSLDPDFVVAWALLSHQYNRLYREQEPRQERKEAAWTAAQRAVELAPDLPDGWLARGRYFAYCERDHQRALAEYQRALEIRPGDRDVQEWTSYSLRRLGRWPESIAMLEKVIEADPLNSTVHRNIGTSYLTVRNFPQAERAFNRSIAIAPETVEGYMGKWYLFFWQGHLSGARAVLEEMRSSSSLSRVNWIRQEWAERRFKEALHRIAHMPESDYENAWGTAAWKFADECWTFVLMGDGDGAGAPCERARAGFEEQVERYPESPRAHLALSRTYSALGRREEAIAAAQRAVTILPISRDIAGAGLVENLAWIYSWFGEYDEAFDRLDNLLSIPSHVNVGRLRVDPQWDHVRDDPRFQELLERYDIQSN
jgi:serine/threonine-protein kinase